MSEMFIKHHKRIRMIKANDDGCRDRMIRLYKGSPDHWEFQFCAPVGLGFAGLRDGKDFIHATVSCSLADLRALRDAIDSQISSFEPEGLPEVSAGTKRMLTRGQLKALRAAGAKGWHPYGGPEHRVARRLSDLGLYSSGTGKPTTRGRAYLERVAR